MLPYEIYCSTILEEVQSGKDLKGREKPPWKWCESKTEREDGSNCWQIFWTKQSQRHLKRDEKWLLPEDGSNCWSIFFCVNIAKHSSRGPKSRLQPEERSNSWLIDWCAINWLTPRQKGRKLVQYKERFLVPRTRNLYRGLSTRD